MLVRGRSTAGYCATKVTIFSYGSQSGKNAVDYLFDMGTSNAGCVSILISTRIGYSGHENHLDTLNVYVVHPLHVLF